MSNRPARYRSESDIYLHTPHKPSLLNNVPVRRSLFFAAASTTPLSPLNPYRYTPKGDSDHIALEPGFELETEEDQAFGTEPPSSPTLTATDMSSPIVDSFTSFPPALGSSSPPIPSPTPNTLNPFFRTLPTSPTQTSTSTANLFSFSRPLPSSNNAQASTSTSTTTSTAQSNISFASRARARQPVLPDPNSHNPHLRWGTRPTRASTTSTSTTNPNRFSSFGESIDEMTIKGTMWRGKLKKLENEVEKKRGRMSLPGGMGGGMRRKRVGVGRGKGGDDPFADDEEMDEEMDEEERDETEEIFRRMMQKQKRQLAHQVEREYERQVGGSDPAILEADIRDAEAAAAMEEEEMNMHMHTEGGTGPSPGVGMGVMATPFGAGKGKHQETQSGGGNGDLWQYRQPEGSYAHGIPMSTPAHPNGSTQHPASSVPPKSTPFRPFGMDTSHDSNDPNTAMNDDVELDEEELARLAEMEEEERLMVEQFGNGMFGAGSGSGNGAGQQQGAEHMAQGWTWDDDDDGLEDDTTMLDADGDVEMA